MRKPILRFTKNAGFTKKIIKIIKIRKIRKIRKIIIPSVMLKLKDSVSHTAIIAFVANISVAAGISLLVPLLALNLEVRGESEFTIGLMGSVTGVGIIFAPFLLNFLLKYFKILHILIAAFSATILTTTLHLLYYHLTFWFVLRFLSALAFTIIFIMIDHWMVSLYRKNKQMFILGFYAVTFSIGYALGPIMLSIFDIYSWIPYSLIWVFCLIPIVLLLLQPRNTLHQERSKSNKLFLKFFPIAPLAFLSAFLTGAMEVAMADLLPIFGRLLGMATKEAAFLLTFFSLGGIVIQLALIWLYRFFHRDTSILLSGMGIALGALALPFVLDSWLLYVVICFWSGFMLVLFPLGLAVLSDHFDDKDLLHANVLFGLAYGIGAVSGPGWIGYLMDELSVAGFPIAVFTLSVLFLILFRVFTWPGFKSKAAAVPKP